MAGTLSKDLAPATAEVTHSAGVRSFDEPHRRKFLRPAFPAVRAWQRMHDSDTVSVHSESMIGETGRTIQRTGLDFGTIRPTSLAHTFVLIARQPTMSSPLMIGLRIFRPAVAVNKTPDDPT